MKKTPSDSEQEIHENKFLFYNQVMSKVRLYFISQHFIPDKASRKQSGLATLSTLRHQSEG